MNISDAQRACNFLQDLADFKIMLTNPDTNEVIAIVRGFDDFRTIFDIVSRAMEPVS